MAVIWQPAYTGAMSLAAERRKLLLMGFVKTPG